MSFNGENRKLGNMLWFGGSRRMFSKALTVQSLTNQL